MKILLLSLGVLFAFGALGSFLKGKFGDGIGFVIVAWLCFAFANSRNPPPPPPPPRHRGTFSVFEH